MKFIPHDYQRYAISRIVSDPAVGLFLDMGLGKTVITLTAVYDLKFQRWSISRCLVVAPKKVAEATWSQEAKKWDHLQDLRIIPVLGSATARIRALNTPGDVWVINRENIPWLVEYYRNGWPFDMVVLDESSSFKNYSCKRFKALKMVRNRIGRLVELTGTPAPNGLGADLSAGWRRPAGQDHFQLPGRLFHTGCFLPRADVPDILPPERGRRKDQGGDLRHLRQHEGGGLPDAAALH